MRVREASQLQLPDWRDLGQAALSFSILQCSIRNITIIIITITITIIINLTFIIVECIFLIQYSVSSQKRPDHWDQVPNVWYIHTIQRSDRCQTNQQPRPRITNRPARSQRSTMFSWRFCAIVPCIVLRQVFASWPWGERILWHSGAQMCILYSFHLGGTHKTFG